MKEMVTELEYLVAGCPTSANTMRAAEWALEEIARLTHERDQARSAKDFTSKNTVDELMAKLLAREGDLAELRIYVFGLGRKLRDYELTDDQVVRFGEEIIKLSGVCENCQGTGQDGDPPDANGVGGGIFICQRCDGTGFHTANTAVSGGGSAPYTGQACSQSELEKP